MSEPITLTARLEQLAKVGVELTDCGWSRHDGPMATHEGDVAGEIWKRGSCVLSIDGKADLSAEIRLSIGTGTTTTARPDQNIAFGIATLAEQLANDINNGGVARAASSLHRLAIQLRRKNA